jgi:hypothetical protein
VVVELDAAGVLHAAHDVQHVVFAYHHFGWKDKQMGSMLRTQFSAILNQFMLKWFKTNVAIISSAQIAVILVKITNFSAEIF